MKSTTLRDLVDNLRSHGNRTAVISMGDATVLKTISYESLWQFVLHASRTLATSYGVRPGSRVALSPSNDILGLVAFLAIVYVGASCIMVPANEPPDRRRDKIRGTRPDLWLSNDELLTVEGVRSERISVLEVIRDGGESSESRSHPSSIDPAVIFFTTGSTAASKAVVQSHGNVISNCYALARHHEINVDDRLLGSLPIHYANGLELSLITPLLVGATAVLLRRFDPLTYLEICDQQEVTIASVVPSILDAISASRGEYALHKLRYFVSAAAPLSARTANAIWSKFNKQIVQGYGLSETTNFSTSLPINLTLDQYKDVVLEATIPSVGHALDGEVEVLDDLGNVLPLGARGEVCMRGSSVMLGYDANPAANREAFRGGWFRSGDEGYFRALDGSAKRLLVLTGRFKNIVKVGGIGVSLDEMDRVAQTVAGVRDAVSVRRTHPVFGEAVLLLVALEGSGSSQHQVERDVLRRLSEAIGLPPGSVSMKIKDELPRTANGKVMRWSA